MHDFHVMLDSGANCGIFKNAQLLTNMHETDCQAIISGIGGKLSTNVVGVFNGTSTVFFHPEAIANILSQSQEHDIGASITYHDKQDEYTVQHEGCDTLLFERVGGLYCYDASNPKVIANNTVEENKKKYTKREVRKAEEAARVRRRLFYPSDEAIPKLSSINNIPVTRKDITRSIDIFGRDKNAIRGKLTDSKTETIPLEPAWKPTEQDQFLSVDLFFIDGDGYMIAVMSPLDYTSVVHIKNRKTAVLRGALWKILAKIDQQHYEVSYILTDNEGGVTALFPELQRAGYGINPAGAGDHVPIVERKIRTIKERVRAYLQSIPYTLMFSLLRYLVEFCVTMINLLPDDQRVDPTSPHEAFTGLKVDYNRQLRISFGDYAECKNPNRKPINGPKPRSDPCIALLPTLNQQGSYVFFDLGTRRTVIRSKWVELPLSDDIIDRCNHLAKNQGKKLRVLPFFSRGEPRDEDDNSIAEMSDHELFDHNDAPSSSDSDSEDSDPDDDESEDDSPPHETDANPEEPLHYDEADRERMLDMQNPTGPFETVEPENLYVEQPIATETVHRYSTRSRGEAPIHGPYKEGRRWVNTVQRKSRFKKAMWHAMLTIKHKNNFGVYSNMTISEAIDRFGDPAKQAVINELQQLIRLNVFKFHDPNLLTPKQLKARIPSKTFVKPKYFPNGLFNKIKARLVGGGHRQKRYLYTENDTSSPTISLVGLFIIATIAARERRHVITMDIGGAYLRAYMKKQVLVLINKEESDILIELYPELRKYRDENGKLTAQAMKALYGCIESGKLWYDTLSSKLLANGYVQNPYDKCIFNKWHESEGVQSTIGIHVDDCFISCTVPDILESIVQWFAEEFEDLNVTRGCVHQFTGMTLDYTHSDKLIVTMKNQIDNLLEKTGVKGTAVNPSEADLFTIDATSPNLDRKRADEFHSIVATISYIAKRIKPECLVVTSMLASRVKNPTEQDWSKLERLLAYINHTREIPLCLEMDKCYPVRISASIDSSHATHGDYRGHTGVYITLGKGCIQAVSVKQTINTKSSAESELVAVSDGATPVINVQNIILSQGLACEPALIDQDNQSTLAMLEKGQATGPTSRHINIRYFWLTDRILNGEVQVRYVESGDMTADALTKTLQGHLFYKHRTTLLNTTE
jgi:hypothetical protein